MTRWWSFRWPIVVVATVFMIFLTNLGRSQPQTNFLTQSCSAVNVINLQIFLTNLNETYRDIRRQLSNNNTYFATSNVASNSEPVYVMAQCRKYMSTSDCLGCFDFAASSIRSCAAYNGARLVLDGCFLRYESSSFNDQTTLPGENRVLCGNSTSSQQSNFETTVDGLLSNLSIATPETNGLYAAATAPIVGTNTSTVYAIAQCAETVTPDRCKSCLQEAHANIRSCATDATDGRAVNLGCFMSYSATAFFRSNQTIDIAPFLRDESSSNKVAVIGGVVGGVGGVIFLLIVVILWWYRRSKRTKPKGSLSRATELQDSKDYNYIDLKKATNDFGDENKLGEGGFGDVYKAILDTNKVVAVKKLKVQHAGAKIGFENEISLISQIRHRNLLGLLGWCSKESNLLLVLEYMPNGSLDRFLWGERKGTLNWERRYDIILGIARGLAHLHKEVHVKIVHRDIKSSNILLDDDFQPKIADFGLARFQPEDQSHVITKFVGTLGYTAPEYVRYGTLSDKVDTFSYGIVILEIISGRICTYQNIDGDGLLEHAWKLYENQNVVMLVDETMDVNPDEEKHVKKIIEIALLCTQSPASKRPTMSEVVLMLSKDPSWEERQLTRPNLLDQNRRINIRSS